MTRILLSAFLISAVTASALADPFSNVGAHGVANYSALISTHNYPSAGSSGSYDLSGDTSFYAGGGDNLSIYDNWTYYEYGYIGDDEYGNPIYGDIPQDQTEYAEVSANAYSRFDRSLNTIGAEVYAYGYSNSWSTGSYASASAFADANATMDLNFTLTSNTMVRISSDTSYSNGNLSLLVDGSFFIDSAHIPGSYITLLPAGDYTITGAAYGDGGANMTIEAVPEPASIAALGLGAVALLRRRRK